MRVHAMASDSPTRRGFLTLHGSLDFEPWTLTARQPDGPCTLNPGLRPWSLDLEPWTLASDPGPWSCVLVAIMSAGKAATNPRIDITIRDLDINELVQLSANGYNYPRMDLTIREWM